jgi:hypothetical protein
LDCSPREAAVPSEERAVRIDAARSLRHSLHAGRDLGIGDQPSSIRHAGEHCMRRRAHEGVAMCLYLSFTADSERDGALMITAPT